MSSTSIAKLVGFLRWGTGAVATALLVAGCGGGGGGGNETASEPASAQLNPVAAFALAQQSVIAPPAGTAALPVSGNMLVNGGFESGADGWVNWGNASVVPEQANSGTSALSVGTAAGGAGQVVTGVVPGNTYRLTAQAKVNAASETVYVGINFLDAAAQPFTQNSVLVTSTAYTTASLDVVAPAGAVSALVYVWKNAGTGLAFVDDLAFALTGTAVQQVPSSGNLLVNGGFDSGGSPWDNFGNLSLSSTQAAVGPLAMQVGTGAGGTGQFVGGIVPGSSYRVSAWTKASVAGEIGYLGVMFLDAAGNGLQAQNVVFRSTAYLRVQADVTAPANASRAQVFIWKNAGSGFVFVDDVALTRIVPDSSAPQNSPPEVQVAPDNFTRVTPLLLGRGYVMWDSSGRVQRFGPDGQEAGAPAVINPGGSGFELVPLLDGGYAAVWLTALSNLIPPLGGPMQLWTQAYTASGAPTGAALPLAQVIPLGLGPVAFPRIAPLADGGYVVVWGRERSAGSTVTDTSVYAQRVNAAGVRAGPVLQVTPNGTGFFGVTGLASGGFLVSWGDLSGEEGGTRAYSAAGEPLGPARDAGASWAGNATAEPMLAPLADGGAVMVWGMPGPVTAIPGFVRSQTFSAAGVPSPMQLVDSQFGGAPAVAGLPGGDYVIVWAQAGDMYARRYAPDSTPVGPATRVNLVTSRTERPAVVALEDGRFVVSWRAIGGGTGLFARTFPADALITP